MAAQSPAPASSPGALEAFPPDRSITEHSRIAGKDLSYTTTVGSLPVVDASGRRLGEVVFTSYVKPSKAPRPVTFVFNGGPGSSSGFLNLGAMGPKRASFGAQGDAPSDPVQLRDNPYSWLEFTDLVFIDPIGTGFSRSLVGPDESKRTFYGVDQDARYLAGAIFDWLKLNGRLASDKYVAGESYGGFRAPRVVNELQVWRGVGVKGLILISPLLDGGLMSISGVDTPLTSPMPWVIRLPSMAAANLEANGTVPTPERMAEVENYAISDFATTYMKGRTDPAALEKMVGRVAAYSGLDPALVRSLGGRIEQDVFLRERFRKQGVVGGRYDINVTYYDPDPWAPQLRAMDSVAATFTTVGGTMADYMTRVVGWKAPGRYAAFNPALMSQWEGFTEKAESVTALRAALSLDSKMKVLVVHGYGDMSTPYFATKLVLDQLPEMGDRTRVKLRLYPGGHMFYSRPASGQAFRDDVRGLYETAQ